MTNSTAVTGKSPRSRLLSPQGWIQLVVTGSLFIALHWYVLNILWRTGKTDPAWSHIFLIPFISAYLIYRRKEVLKKLPVERDWKGLVCFILGLVLYTGGSQMNSTMIMGYAMVIEMFGLAWFFLGTQMIRFLWVPIFYLGFGVKFSYVYTYISMLLKRIAATIGAVNVNIFGLPWDIEADSLGAVLNIYHQGMLVQPPLNVAEACSGMRSLMAMAAIAVALAFLEWRPWYSRGIIILAAFPLAVTSNVLRLTVTGILYPFNPALAHGDPHSFAGLLALIPSLAVLILLVKACDRIWTAKSYNEF